MEEDIFKGLLSSSQIFKNKEVLRPSYVPSFLPHREKQIRELASILVPALRGETPSNVFIYGKTGTGKTAVANFTGKKLMEKGKEMDVPIHFIYINCEIVDTQYRILQNITNHFIRGWNERVPFTGWPTDEVYARLIKSIDKARGVTIIVLDEVDKVKGDEVLYNLSRINNDLKVGRASVIGISNDLKFTEFLDPRVKSSLGEENLVFPPYTADELKDILNERVKLAFKENTIDESVVALCAAKAAQEHGDARRALDLLRVSAEIAERLGDTVVKEKHVRLAEDKIELDRITEIIRTLPIQTKIVLKAAVIGTKVYEELNTGDLYNIYRDICKEGGYNVLTQRRIADIISELDMMGILNARVISKGRYGRTRQIELSMPSKIEEILERDSSIPRLKNYVPRQSKLDYI
ncbi:MAG: ORC1-type DNA replication protein [Thermoplasmata archaeon]|jgi:cell division control protein 6|nr:MAG: ORC1-type DNA replication protein [Thermoplasmata archaeon]MCD6222533.1 ORC1-type DNA replication protein [Thermoplasmata archaeon]